MIAISVFMISLYFMGVALQTESLIIGMILGMFLFPIIMYAVKKWKTKRKVRLMLKELSEMMRTRKEQEKNETS